MPSSTLSHKFLLDENVNRKLYRFLKDKGLDVELAPESTNDKQLAEISKSERRILVTNDEDFIEYSDEDVYSVVWLRINQSNSSALISTFNKLLNKFNDYSGKIIILEKEKWTEFPLMQELRVKG